MKNYLDRFKLNGKVAFITGGFGMIGIEVTRALLDAEAKVIVLDINEEKAQKIAGIKFEKFDVTDLENIDQVIDDLCKKYGGIDIWVNAAYPRTSDWGNKLEDISIDSWRKNIDNHLNSYALISRKVCLLMRKQKGGSLINFGSIYGVVGNNFNIYEGTNLNPPAGYAAIKGGIVNLDRYLASYFGKDNVRVNTICPGGIFDNQDPKFVKNYEKNTLLKRMGRPEDIAGAVLFLASDASTYITGTTLMVDGGWTAI